MKIRTDFVTNSSSSSFTILIGFQLTDGDRICFQAEGGIPEEHSPVFAGEAIASVSPKQLGAAENIEELLSLLSEGIYDKLTNRHVFKKYVEQKEKRSISKENGITGIFVENPRDFIAAIRCTIGNMDQIEKITIGGYESNYADYNRVYTYNLKTDEYTGAVEGRPMREIDGGNGGDLRFDDLRKCKITRVKASSLANYNWYDYEGDCEIEDDGVLLFHNRPRLGFDVFNATEGESVFFGHYEQDCNETNGPEDIEWIVLKVEKNRALVVSKYALDRQNYGGQSWSRSSLRKWLNNIFSKIAFTSEEMARIAPVTILSDGDYKFVDPEDIKKSKKQSANYIFILDSDEVESYGIEKCMATKYAYKMGAIDEAFADDERYVDYWSRDISFNSTCICVRPAMWINFEKTALVLPLSADNNENTQPDIEGLTIVSNEVISYVGKAKDLVLPNGIKKINERAFANTSIKSVVLPKSLSKLEEKAFFECKKLCSINIPEAITSIPKRTFRSCTSLKSIILPGGIKTIRDSAFNNCSSLTEFVFPPLLKVITRSVLADCTSLEKVYIPNGVTTIDSQAFWGCSALKEIRFPETVTIIRDCAFWQCKSLTNIYLSQNVVSIGENAFLTENENTVIHAPAGSYAETYAKENKIQFVAE